MESEQRRKRLSRGEKRRRRRIRRIQIWTVRMIFLAVFLLAVSLIIKGGMLLWERTFRAKKTVLSSGIVVDVGEKQPDKTRIILDAGHGGNDQGTSSGDILEKDVNLELVKLLREELENNRTEIVFTRTDDTKIELEDRASMANELDADLFVSIHCNYCEDDSSVQGLECYHQEDREGGKRLAEHIIEKVEEKDVVSRGVKTADFLVLVRTEMPAVLVELGYFSNKEECQLLTSRKHQSVLARQIAEGIRSFLLDEEGDEEDAVTVQPSG